MGCSTSKLDDEEAVQLCKDRKKFIKQAVEQRRRFASGHIAYIQSMKRVSAALKEYIEGDEPREFLLDSFVTPPPMKKTNFNKGGFISITPNSFSVVESHPSIRISYLKSGGNPTVSVEEQPPQSPETVRIQSYSPVHYYGTESYFAMQSPTPNNQSFFHYSPDNNNNNNNRSSSSSNLPPTSPQTSSQWDFFWNPFNSLDYYSGYPNSNFIDDENARLRQVREEEGIPDLEEETEQEDSDNNREELKNKDEVIVEDVNDSESESESETTDCETEAEHEKVVNNQNIQVAPKAQNTGQQISSAKSTTIVDNLELKEAETPGFTVYLNRKPTSMAEVIKDLEAQFIIACNSANEVSAILEASRAQYYSPSKDLTAMKMLNPVALIRSASSSRSNSSRFLINTLKDDEESCSSECSEDVCMFSGSHQSTLDRLYAWEKKLYIEVREGERTRIAYEKKCAHLRNQDVKGADPSSVDKTRTAMRDLHTQIKVSIHSVEAVSKRIETLRDEELQPQLLELVQGLARMWKVMSECHQMQKRTLEEAKILLAGMPSKLSGTKKYTLSTSEPHRLARSASNLETELRNWRASFESWIVAQRSYMQALSGWLLRCVRLDPDTTSKLPFSPRRSSSGENLPIFNICIQWSRFLESTREVPVLEGLDFFAAGIGSLYAKQLKEDSQRSSGGSRRFSGDHHHQTEVVEVEQFEEEVMTAEKMAEVAIRVLCAGMSVAVNSLTEFAVASGEGYADLVKQLENMKQRRLDKARV